MKEYAEYEQWLYTMVDLIRTQLAEATKAGDFSKCTYLRGNLFIAEQAFVTWKGVQAMEEERKKKEELEAMQAKQMAEYAESYFKKPFEFALMPKHKN